MMDSRRLNETTIYPANHLVEAFRVKPNGRSWHDKPVGEYLAIDSIPSTAFLGSVTYQSIHQQIEILLPELADKPFQLLEELQYFYHGSQNRIVRATKERLDWSVSSEEYLAVRHICRGFLSGPDSLDHQHSLPLTLMLLSFRRRDLRSLP